MTPTKQGSILGCRRRIWIFYAVLLCFSRLIGSLAGQSISHLIPNPAVGCLTMRCWGSIIYCRGFFDYSGFGIWRKKGSKKRRVYIYDTSVNNYLCILDRNFEDDAEGFDVNISITDRNEAYEHSCTCVYSDTYCPTLVIISNDGGYGNRACDQQYEQSDQFKWVAKRISNFEIRFLSRTADGLIFQCYEKVTNRTLASSILYDCKNPFLPDGMLSYGMQFLNGEYIYIFRREDLVTSAAVYAMKLRDITLGANINMWNIETHTGTYRAAAAFATLHNKSGVDLTPVFSYTDPHKMSLILKEPTGCDSHSDLTEDVDIVIFLNRNVTVITQRILTWQRQAWNSTIPVPEIRFPEADGTYPCTPLIFLTISHNGLNYNIPRLIEKSDLFMKYTMDTLADDPVIIAPPPRVASVLWCPSRVILWGNAQVQDYQGTTGAVGTDFVLLMFEEPYAEPPIVLIQSQSRRDSLSPQSIRIRSLTQFHVSFSLIPTKCSVIPGVTEEDYAALVIGNPLVRSDQKIDCMFIVDGFLDTVFVPRSNTRTSVIEWHAVGYQTDLPEYTEYILKHNEGQSRLRITTGGQVLGNADSVVGNCPDSIRLETSGYTGQIFRSQKPLHTKCIPSNGVVKDSLNLKIIEPPHEFPITSLVICARIAVDLYKDATAVEWTQNVCSAHFGDSVVIKRRQTSTSRVCGIKCNLLPGKGLSDNGRENYREIDSSTINSPKDCHDAVLDQYPEANGMAVSTANECVAVMDMTTVDDAFSQTWFSCFMTKLFDVKVQEIADDPEDDPEDDPDEVDTEPTDNPDEIDPNLQPEQKSLMKSKFFVFALVGSCVCLGVVIAVAFYFKRSRPARQSFSPARHRFNQYNF